MTALLWLRRDVRRRDLPALGAAAAAGGSAGVVVAFVVDPSLWGGGAWRTAWLAANLQAAHRVYEGRLVLRFGDPREEVPRLAAEVRAGSVHVSRETTPSGRVRDSAVADALRHQGVDWVETGTPYAVGPGVVRNASGGPYRVFTPFAKAWRDHGWPAPAGEPGRLRLTDAPSDPAAWAAVRDAQRVEGLPPLPEPGEDAALRSWRAFLAERLAAYEEDRDRPDVPGTSQLSPYLKLGVLHPRTLLADLVPLGGEGAVRFETELAWREFYADVLWHNPSSAWSDLQAALSGLRYDTQDDAIAAWKNGRTGYPVVDAGMRQLLATGWMHNRVRMITASFLTKDLHAWWPVGARHFMDHLIDGDLASNNHGWQWVAGTGTDAAPYFRVFNPVTQGMRFDPDGAYVRTWVPELAHLAGAGAHEPWKHADGYARGYVGRIVDHAAERAEALRRYEAARVRAVVA